MKYVVLIWPDSYDDPDDIGYEESVEAATREEAIEACRRICEDANGWEEGRLTDDNCRTIEISPDWREIAEELKNFHDTYRPADDSETSWEALDVAADRAAALLKALEGF